jgi:hypothetical protein
MTLDESIQQSADEVAARNGVILDGGVLAPVLKGHRPEGMLKGRFQGVGFLHANVCFGWRIQPVDATVWLNISAGVW